MPTTQPAATGSRVDHRWLSLGVLALGLAMIVLDGTIVGVALPAIISDLGLGMADAEWVNALYAVVFAALLMSFGRLGDLVGRRVIFIMGVIIFAGSSVVAAMAGSASALIAARALQGLGGAMVLPSSLSTVNATFRDQDRAAAFGVWGAVMAGAAAIGPLLGGWLTTSFSWRWIFWVNIPIGLLVVTGALVVTLETRGESDISGFDWGGLVLSSAGFGALVFGIIEGPALGWLTPSADFDLFGFFWPATRPVSLAAVMLALGMILIAAFLGWQRYRIAQGNSVILNLSLFGIPTFSWGNVTALAVAVGEFALVFVLPLYLVGVLGLSSMGAGWVLATMAFGAFLAGASARHLANRLGPPRVVILGLALEVLGVGAVALTLSSNTAPWVLALLLGVYGVGLGLASAQLTSTVLRDVPRERSGQGSATQSTVRQLGSGLGTALAGSALAAGLTHYLTRNIQAIPGLTTDQVTLLVDGTASSVGGNLAYLRELASVGFLGPDGDSIVAALASGFTSAAVIAVWVAAVFLLLGLVGSFQVARAAKESEAALQPPSER